MGTETAVATDFNISETLKQLGIKEINYGASTGTKWINTSGEIIESYASADGALIGKIKQGTTDDYEKIKKVPEVFEPTYRNFLSY